MSVYAALLLSLIVRLTKGNYLCVCNYNVEQGVLPFPDPQAKPMGYMYEFDCKSVVQQADLNTEQWHAIAYQGQIAYLQVNSNIQETMCSGFIPKFDQITTITPAIQVTSVNPTSTSELNNSKTATTQPVLNSQRSSVDSISTSTANSMIPSLATNDLPTDFTKDVSNIKFKTTQSLPVILSGNVTTTARISTSNEQTTLPNLLGLSQVTSMSNSSKTSNSGTTLNSWFNKTSPQQTVISAMSSQSTKTSRSTSLTTPTTVTTATERPAMTTSSTKDTKTTHSMSSPITITIPTTFSPTIPSIIGDITQCSSKLLQYTKEDGGALTQYGNKCYELVPFKLIWTKAELDCQAKGGHLLTVQTEGFKDYIYNWIRRFVDISAVWLGVSDRRGNGWFDWTSGEQLVSTFWVEESFVDHFDNCGIMLLDETSKGGWKPVTCGKTTATGDQGSQYSFICEYPIMPHSLSAGAIGR